MHHAIYGFPVSDFGGVVSIRVRCEEGCVGDGLVSAVADVEGDASSGEEQPVLGGMSEVSEDTFEGIPVSLGRCSGGYRPADDKKVYLLSDGVSDITQVSKYLLELFRLGAFRKRLVLVCGAMETNTILIRCRLAVGNVNFCFAQDSGSGCGLGDVQRTFGSVLYSPAKQGA